MKRTTSTLAALAMGAFLFSHSNDAKALGPVDIEIAAKGGLGSNPTDGPVNPLGFGLGARGGVAIIGIYAGLNVMNYFGGSVPGTDNTFHTFMLGVEGGYGIKLLDILTLRLQLGVGNATLSAGDFSTKTLYLEPGVTALVSLGSLFVGADLNGLFLTSVDKGDGTSSFDKAVTMHAQVGVKF